MTRNQLFDAMSKPFDQVSTDVLWRLIMHCSDVRLELHNEPIRSCAVREHDHELCQMINGAKQTLQERPDAPPQLTDVERSPLARLLSQALDAGQVESAATNREARSA